MYGRKPTKTVVSAQILHVLELARKNDFNIWWVPLVDGKGSQSRTVGRALTIEACQRNGWLDREGKLLPAGDQILTDHKARELERLQRALRKKILEYVHWEKGYRCHGLWPNDEGERIGYVGLGPPSVWDGVYTWSVDRPGGAGCFAEGEASTLKDAKDAVVDAYWRMKTEYAHAR